MFNTLTFYIMADSNSNADKKNAKTGARHSSRTAPVYSVLTKARAQYKRQITQNVETKRECIKMNISAYYDDALRFWLDFENETKDLLDSKRFCEKCEEIGIKPHDAAEHVVFEGKSIKNRVWKNGLEATLGDKARMFNAPLYEDKEGIYGKKQENGNE